MQDDENLALRPPLTSRCLRRVIPPVHATRNEASISTNLLSFMATSDSTSKIIMQGIHVDLTPALQRATREKLDPLLRHDARIIRINVRLHQDQKLGQDYHYTATAEVEMSGPNLVAHADDKDAYAALDQLAQKLDQLLERRHGRRKDKRNHPRSIELDNPLPKVSQTESTEPA
jgi:putative sigma-54 modulation protein